MTIKSLRPDLQKHLRNHQLEKKFVKQSALFTADPRHSSLHTEILAPKELRLYSFRIDRKYRAIFILTAPDEIEIIDINNHYQ